MKIAVIGAGPAGLVTLKILQERFASSEVEVTCFEGSDQLGGEWVKSEDKPDTSKWGWPIQSSTYPGMQCNIFTHDMELTLDYRFPKDAPCFPMRERTLQYFQDYAEHFELRKYIKYNQLVVNIEKLAENNQLRVTTVDTKKDEKQEHHFQYIFMCCGQHRKPNIPDEYDLGQFKGQVLHYHHMYDPKRFDGKNVLIVGGGFGAMDLVITLRKIAKRVTLTWHRSPPKWGVNETCIEMKPTLVRGEGSSIFFKDGSRIDDVDVVLYATGFLHSDPLAPDLKLDFDKSSTLFPLYKSVVHPNCPNMFFVGKQSSMIVSSLRFHVELGVSIIKGHVQVPSKDEMLADIEQWRAKWAPILAQTPNIDITKFSPVNEMDFERMNEIADLAGVPRQRPALLKSFYALIKSRRDDVFNYRRYKLADNVDDDDCDIEQALYLE